MIAIGSEEFVSFLTLDFKTLLTYKIIIYCAVHSFSSLKMENVTDTTTLVDTTGVTMKLFLVCPECTLQRSKKGRQVFK